VAAVIGIYRFNLCPWRCPLAQARFGTGLVGHSAATLRESKSVVPARFNFRNMRARLRVLVWRSKRVTLQTKIAKLNHYSTVAALDKNGKKE
jgi:hypothetical protein